MAFFSVAQAIWVPEGPWPTVRLNFTIFVGSHAEGVILAFCMVCIIIYLVSFRKWHVGKLLSGSIPLKGSKKLFMFLFMFSVLISSFDVTLFSSGALQTHFPDFLTKLHFIVPPLLALSLSLLMRNANVQGWKYKISLFILVWPFSAG